MVWKNLMEFDFDFDTEYNNAENFSRIVLKVKHRNKYQIAHELMDHFNSRAKDFIDANPFDPTDPDIIALQNKVRKMIANLNQLATQLI